MTQWWKATEYELVREQKVPHPRERVAAFFEAPANLERITPLFLRFRIVTPGPVEMKPGALIDYTISLHGVPIKWRTLIESYDPGHSFVDTQLKGPYSLWHHTHTFLDTSDGGTLVHDHVRYRLPLGPLGRLAHSIFVKRQLEAIFAHRFQVIEQLFPASPSG